MTLVPKFPTALHEETASIIRDFFVSMPAVDSILVVNSCARGQATAESDLDFAILANPGSSQNEIMHLEASWQIFSQAEPRLVQFKKSNQFAAIHLDIIDGNYKSLDPENGEPIDNFEIEIGNQICYSAPLGNAGLYFQELQHKWLPYYNEDLRTARYKKVISTCHYDLDHIPTFISRGLHFQAFDILCKAFQKYLQALFIAHKTYPIAYNKWIREQVVNWLKQPILYSKLPPVLSVSNIESNQTNDKALLLRELLNNITEVEPPKVENTN